jgi:hypothetical protein
MITSNSAYEEMLEALHERLAHERVVVLQGARGLGKTTLARNFVSRFQSEYQHVIWIDAATPELLLCSVQALAKDEDLFSQPLPRDIVGITACIQDWTTRLTQTLLVLDHVQLADPGSFAHGQFENSTGPRPTAHILLLPTEEVPGEHFASLTVQPHEGTSFLVSQAHHLQATSEGIEYFTPANADEADELVRELQGLPLPLLLAGRLLSLATMEYADYLAAYRDAPEPAMPRTSAANTITALAVELSLRYLAASAPLAHTILTCCALLAAHPIPPALFQQPALAPLLSPGDPAADQPAPSGLQIQEVLQTLLHTGFLKKSTNTDEIQMQRLLQELVRSTLSPELALQIAGPLVQACLQLAQAQAQSAPRLYLLLAGHIRVLAARFTGPVHTSEKVAEAFLWSASLLNEASLLHEAITLLQTALLIWERTLGPIHPTIAGTLTQLAQLYARVPSYAEAEIYAVRAIMTTSQASGINHPRVLYGLLVLARIYQQEGKSQEAIHCLKKALLIGNTVNLQHHPYYGEAQRQLALLSQVQADDILSKESIFIPGGFEHRIAP